MSMSFVVLSIVVATLHAVICAFVLYLQREIDSFVLMLVSGNGAVHAMLWRLVLPA